MVQCMILQQVIIKGRCMVGSHMRGQTSL
jgi:hypothetical protein